MPEFKMKGRTSGPPPAPPPLPETLPDGVTAEEWKLARWLHERIVENEEWAGQPGTLWADLKHKKKCQYARLARTILAADFADILR